MEHTLHVRRWRQTCKPKFSALFFFYQGFSSNLQLHSQSQSVINLYEDSMSVAAFSQIPFSAICKTNLINLILMIVIIIVIIVVVVVASLCVSWQRCLSRCSRLSPEYRNSWSNPFELWHNSSSCVHANCFAALPAACWGKKRFDSVICSARERYCYVYFHIAGWVAASCLMFFFFWLREKHDLALTQHGGRTVTRLVE